ncbi:thiamine phosphate synthase [Aquimarina sp. AD10]|uniref:thiamine phosphate synthase n=1 Tax=Aquimarina sp. AD10 TaxID=1714849 RepID=UPI000E489E39|nr:thiamine phosphate synthase [Aquimarina sp. AD10]AXT62206.1 thiamine phosphate synthase [Aquimarina sp. AD10]RKM90599.1 thiamine phosphate synthase [Aquimarina sp. AD10]
MLIVLTSEKPLTNEAEQINNLFKAGLEILHLRKPTFTIDGYRALLDQIDAKYHNKIMIHQFPELTIDYNLRGIHLQEQARLDLEDALEVTAKIYTNKGFAVSSSFHSKEDIKNCPVDFEYVLLSPVFGSISKAGYKGKGFDVTDLDAFVIGMGGVNEDTLQATFDLGFKGVGVLGGIWSTEDSLESFLKINKVNSQLVK